MYTYLEALINTNYTGPNTIYPRVYIKTYVPKPKKHVIEVVYEETYESDDESEESITYDEEDHDYETRSYDHYSETDSDSEYEDSRDFVGCRSCYYFGYCGCCD